MLLSEQTCDRTEDSLKSDEIVEKLIFFSFSRFLFLMKSYMITIQGVFLSDFILACFSSPCMHGVQVVSLNVKWLRKLRKDP